MHRPRPWINTKFETACMREAWRHCKIACEIINFLNHVIPPTTNTQQAPGIVTYTGQPLLRTALHAYVLMSYWSHVRRQWIKRRRNPDNQVDKITITKTTKVRRHVAASAHRGFRWRENRPRHAAAAALARGFSRIRRQVRDRGFEVSTKPRRVRELVMHIASRLAPHGGAPVGGMLRPVTDTRTATRWNGGRGRAELWREGVKRRYGVTACANPEMRGGGREWRGPRRRLVHASELFAFIHQVDR